ASYRPITLLNTDYKLATRAIASRIGPLLSQVADATQTGFLPKRWIGDNVL
ncbi:polymerase-like protein, partial [Coccomyxa subellipsoidea C-169]